jgi:hypothetical protein
MSAEGIRPLRFALAALVTLAGVAGAADVAFRTFDADPLGLPPTGFSFSMARQAGPGTWAVRSWAFQQHLEHDADAASAGGLSLAVVGPAVRNVQVSVKLQLVDGERTGGVVWRYQGRRDFYGAAIDLRQPEISLFRVSGGNRVRLDRISELDLDHELSHTLLVRHQGDDIHVQVDGIGVLQVRDRAFPGAGRAGVWSGGASRTWFDDLRIEDVAERRW